MKASVCCLIDHKFNTAIMEGKPTQFFIDLHEKYDGEAAQLDSMIDQWDKAQQSAKKVSETVKWGLDKVLKRIDSEMSMLSSAKKAMDDLRGSTLQETVTNQKEVLTIASIGQKIDSIGHLRRFAQSRMESVKASLPTTKSLQVLVQILQLGFLSKEDELNCDQKDQLKRLEEAVVGSTDDVANLSPKNGDVVGSFGVTLTFYRNGSTNWRDNSELGSVFIKPDHHIYSKLHHGAEFFEEIDPNYSWDGRMSTPILYETEIVAVRLKKKKIIDNVN